MRTTPITSAHLASSVIAVPPLARDNDLKVNPTANAKLIKHLEQGGVRSLLYGGNANFYNISLGEYASTLEVLTELAGPDTWLIPSVGPDYGKMMDQAQILRDHDFPAAMVLPLTFPATNAGTATGIRRYADASGKNVILYLKAENYLTPETVAGLVADGFVTAIKYAIVRKSPDEDLYLSALLDKIPASIIVSGIGERPAIVHLRKFGLQGFTTGCGCVAPRGSTELLRLIQAARWDEAERVRQVFLPLENCRDALDPIRTLHDAVTFSGIADMGPTLPLLSNLDPVHHDQVAQAARALLANELTVASLTTHATVFDTSNKVS